MPDDIALPGTAETVATDFVDSKHYQRVKAGWGADGAYNDTSAANPLPVTDAGIQQTDLLCRFLDTVGDGTGTKNAIGDYSGAEEEFFIAPAAGQIFHIARLLVTVEDTAGFAAAEYGNLGSALTNGIKLEVRTGASTTVLDFVDAEPITTNAEWGTFNFDVDVKTWGAGNEFLLARWTFSKTDGALRLDGDAGERLSIILEDDLTGLVTHKFLVQGYIVNE